MSTPDAYAACVDSPAHRGRTYDTVTPGDGCGSSRCSTAREVVTLIAVTQEQVRDWWNCNPMSDDVGSPIVAVPASREHFRELDRRVLARPLAQRIWHFSRAELRARLENGQDAELLPLPRKIRVPITDRLPRRLRDAVLDRLGHQLAATAAKPA